MTDYSSPAHQIEHSSRPVLIYFHSNDCKPCRAMEPVIQRIEREYTGILKVVRVNASEEKDLTKRFLVQSVPYLILFKNRRVCAEYPGFMPYASLKDLIDRHL